MIKHILPLILLSLAIVSCNTDTPNQIIEKSAATPPQEELYSSADRDEIIAAARAIIEADPVGALISVDSLDRPRVRSVNTSTPDSMMTIWVATRPG